MALSLEQIENRIKTLIENSVNLLPGSNRPQILAAKLAKALQESLQPVDGSRGGAPDYITVMLPPDEISFWRSQQNFFDTMANALQEMCREAGDRFAAPPVILLAVDPHLQEDDLEIIIADRADPGGKTTEIQLNQVDHPAPENQPPDAFLIPEGSPIFPIEQTVINIGRSPDNHLVIDDPHVSRNHIQIRAVHGQYMVCDLNSSGGTYVNNQRIVQAVLKPGDVISLAGFKIVYEEYADPLKTSSDHSLIGSV